MAGPRRQRRREETLAEILTIAVALMTADGVAALSLAEVARRLGIQQPSLFKYFPSKLALYDAVYAAAAQQVREEFQTAVASAEPGVAALRAGVDAVARFAMANQALAQLLFWRPVPGFTPSPTAFADAIAFTDAVAAVVRVAVERRQLHPDAASQEGMDFLSSLIAGAMTQQLANEPGVSVEKGRFVALLPRLIDMFVAAYPPVTKRGGRR